MATRSLPTRPDLDYLRRQAKELRDVARAGDPDALERVHRYTAPDARVLLSAAQLAIAREYGFASWAKLKAEVEARTTSLAERVDAFLRASVGGPERRAAALLEAYPEIAAYDFRTAVVLGEADRVRDELVNDPGLATRPTAPIGWPPVLGVCSSRWHRIDPRRAAGMLEVARMLLDAGADPNTIVLPRQRGHCSTLYGAAGTANNPQITELLLQYGGDPNAPGRDGYMPMRLATRQGRSDVAELLRSFDAEDLATDVDRLLAASMHADRPRATQLLHELPGLLDRLPTSLSTARVV